MVKYLWLPSLRRVSLIAGGYAFAWGAGSLAVWIRDRRISAADQLAMSGMMAFGDVVLFCAVAAPVAIVPTLLLFSLVRARPAFWRIYTMLSLLIASTGVIEAVFLLIPWTMSTSSAFSQTLHQAAPVRVLAAPIFLLVYTPGLLPSAAPFRKIALAACLFELCTLASFGVFLLMHS